MERQETLTSRQSTDFIGRQQELALLNAALDDALSGRGQMVMLAGEPGIGKTRLAQELASRAESLGARVLWGWCYEHVGAPPYWPYVQPIRAYIETADPQQLSSQMGPGGAEIAEIVPELREKLPDLGQPLAAEPEHARFRLFDSVATFLKNAAQSRPLLFVMDDLHWADESSLLMLEFLTREIAASSVMVLGTYRDVEVTGRHPLSQTLGNLVRERHFRRIQLGGLTLQEVGEFVEASAGIALPSDALETIHSRTEGNPLFVNEVVELINPEQITENRTWADIIPDGVRDAIGRRLSRLSETCNQVLRTASVIGREFDFSLLRTLDSDIGADGVLEALDEALEAKVIEALPSVVGRYQFGHGLIQQALYGDMSSIRRLRAHASIGETLEQMHQTDLEVFAAELARHFAEAESVLGPEKLARYSLMAGERALATYAYEDAITHFERGLVARDITLSGAEAASDEEAAALLFGLARAQSATGVGHQLVEAFATLSRAFEYYAKVGNVALAVAAAEFPIASLPFRIPGVAELMARALTLVPADSYEAGRLLSRYGGILGVAEVDYEGAQEALGRAIAIARREGDVALEVQTRSNAAVVSGNHLRPQESVDNGLRAIELATIDQNPYADAVYRIMIALNLLNMGDLHGARHHAFVLRDLAERRSTPRQIASNSFMPISFLSSLEGNWKEGREYSDRGLALSPLSPQLLAVRALLEHEAGESAQGEVYLERLLEAMRRAGPLQLTASARTCIAIPTIARITGAPDRLEIAEAAAEAILSEQSVSPLNAMCARTGLALLAVQKGDESAAKEHYAHLLGQRNTLLWAASLIDRLLGLLSQTMVNLDQAAPHFEEALAFCRKAGYRPELAWTCHDYANMLIQRSAEGDRAKAMSLLDESLAISSELGMRPLVERVKVLQENAETQPVRTPAYPDGLTQREVEVLQLISGGKTDREIGEELFISVKTVGNHVSNILNKTNTANRTEAATYAARHGIEAGSESG